VSASKAARAEIRIGSLIIDGFQLPDGSYRMSQQQASESIGESPVYALRFLRSRASEALLGESYTDYSPESIEVDSTNTTGRGQTRINALPLEVVTAYWLYRASNGNKQAILMTWALLTESLERRFDNAFGVAVSEAGYQQRLADRISQLENDFGDDLAMGDIYRSWVATLEQQLRDNGIEPWQPPPLDEGSDHP
jgi:hypothetical protein